MNTLPYCYGFNTTNVLEHTLNGKQKAIKRSSVLSVLSKCLISSSACARRSFAVVPRASVSNSRIHSLMRWIIAVRTTAERTSLFCTLGTQHSNTAVAQQAIRGLCDSSPEELATLPAGKTSSAHLVHLALVYVSMVVL